MKDRDKEEKAFSGKWEILKNEPSFKVPDGYFEELEGSLMVRIKSVSKATEANVVQLSNSTFRSKWMSIAAGIVILISLGVGFIMYRNNTLNQQEEILGTLEYINKHSSEYDLELLSILMSAHEEIDMSDSELDVLEDMNLEDLEQFLESEMSTEL